MTINPPKNTHLQSTLSELNNAIEQWDTITNTKGGEQELSRISIKKKTKDLLEKLGQQLEDFSDL